VDKLLKILHRLVETGNSVLVIEHNLDVIKTADYIIDLGRKEETAAAKCLQRGHRSR
jgi:excinuclease ABC subunit A